jgi:hypothetical protein
LPPPSKFAFFPLGPGAYYALSVMRARLHDWLGLAQQAVCFIKRKPPRSLHDLRGRAEGARKEQPDGDDGDYDDADADDLLAGLAAISCSSATLPLLAPREENKKSRTEKSDRRKVAREHEDCGYQHPTRPTETY